MKYCKSCNIKVNSSRKRCPICNSVLQDDGKELIYQSYPKRKEREHIKLPIKIVLFASIMAIIASFIINFKFINNNSPFYWCIIVLFGIPYLWLLVYYTIIKKGLWYNKVNYLFFSTICLVVLINLTICYMKNDFTNLWCVTYSLPGILIISTISLFIVVTCIKKLYIDSIVTLWSYSILCIIYWAFSFIFPNYIFDYLSLPSLGAGIGCLLAMFIFHHRDTKEELIKRFRV